MYKLFLNFYARIKFCMVIKNYQTLKWLDEFLSDGLDSGIEIIIGRESFYVDIEFSNGHSARLWNANYPYAWLCSGTVKSPLGSMGFNDGMPSTWTMWRIRKACKYFNVREMR